MISRQREFIRHPVDIPVQVYRRPGQDSREGLSNLSLGGLAFASDRCWSVGENITVTMAVPFELEITGRVVWCRRMDQRYEVGLTFTSPAEAYKGRMIEQVCHIEHYRRELEQRQGRRLTLDEAANEWIEHFADRFAQTGRDSDEGPPGQPENRKSH